MTREQVSAATEQARSLERLRVWAGSSDEDQAIINEIEQCHEEWLRIVVLMAAHRMKTYQLEGDPLARLQFFAARGEPRTDGSAAPARAGIPVRKRVVAQSRRVAVGP